MLRLAQSLQKERSKYRVFPSSEHVFDAFLYSPYEELKCVIIGDEPYHHADVNGGLAYGVTETTEEIPQVLSTIFTELESDLGLQSLYVQPDLKPWAQSGVLLLNRSLTVRAGAEGSHADLGWHYFTRTVVEITSDRVRPVVFMLWGDQARRLAPLIDQSHHLVIESAHPGPTSAHRGFIGSKPFSKADAFIYELHNGKKIDWYGRMS